MVEVRATESTARRFGHGYGGAPAHAWMSSATRVRVTVFSLSHGGWSLAAQDAQTEKEREKKMKTVSLVSSDTGRGQRCVRCATRSTRDQKIFRKHLREPVG